MSKNWKKIWVKIKGYPWDKEKCGTHLKVFYNCLVHASCFDGNQDVNWFNQQFIMCCNAVQSCLSPGRTSNPPVDDYSCDTVIKDFDHCIDDVKQLQISTVLQDLCRCGMSLVVIWSTLDVSISDLLRLVNICFSDEQLCKTVNPGISYLMKKMVDVSMESKPAPPNLDPAEELSLLHKCHPTFLYLFFVLMYQKQQYEEIVRISSECINDISDESVLTSLHNLTAYCYVHMGKPLMAIMYWRRAVNCAEQFFSLIPLLYNLHRTYAKCNMMEASSETMNILLSVITSTSEKHSKLPWFVFEENNGDFPKVKIAQRHSITDASPIAYYAANNYLQFGNESKAIKWYDFFLNRVGNEYDPSISSCASEYKLPIEVPPIMQITSEYCLALYTNGNLEELLNLNNTELAYCSTSFKRAHSVAGSKNFRQESLSLTERNTFAVSGLQLFHCIAVELYKIGAMLKDDTITAKREINKCLDVIEYIQTVVRSTNDASLRFNDCTDERLISFVESRLCSLKAMLYFNLTLVLSRLPKEDDKEILSALQHALRFDNQNIELRWNVTMLLWDIGQHEESIKTWCKTRNINYKLPPNEIDVLKQAKQAELKKSNSATKKNYLEKDISILNELLRIIS